MYGGNLTPRVINDNQLGIVLLSATVAAGVSGFAPQRWRVDGSALPKWREPGTKTSHRCFTKADRRLVYRVFSLVLRVTEAS